MDGRKGLEPLAMPMAAWLAWLENASSMWSAMSIPATASARLQELLQINGRLTAERDVLLAAAGTLDESRSKVAELQAVAQAAEFARDEVAQRLAAILRESEAAQRKLDDARSETVARAAETETHVVARDMARIELQELQQKIHETEQRLSQLQATLAEVQDAIAGREAAEQTRDGAAAELAALRHDVDAARRDLDDAISQASARRGEAAEYLAAGEQARAELLAVQEQMRAETRALNEQETRLATARATAAGLQAAAQSGGAGARYGQGPTRDAATGCRRGDAEPGPIQRRRQVHQNQHHRWRAPRHRDRGQGAK